MAHPLHPPDHAAVLAEVRTTRRAGVVGLRGLATPELSRVAALKSSGAAGSRPLTVEELLRAAVARTGGGTLRDAAELSLGLADGTRDRPAADRRRLAARVYGVSVERFRKHHELMVLGQVAEQVLLIAAEAAAGERRPDPADAPAHFALPAAHRVLTPLVHGRRATVTVHVHSVDLLRDIDVVVSPSNVYFALPAPYKSSVAATLRRAGARKDPTGALVEDHLHDELREWAVRNGMPGRAALPGTVAATSAGALGDQGVRRVYHAATAVPRPDSNDYDVRPVDVTRSVTAVFALLARESPAHTPPLRSLCLPLLGAGRGGLTPVESFGALWTAVEAELARGAPWDIHLVVRRPARADLVARLLAGPGTAPAAGGV
ncbi:hypothetical protein [Streptomyces sp. NPDC056796]|uniref:hypothetical protein n=1 Tax=Streptomyces sp. NPDC056796 TaxID=3345947 RepID=UPI0036CFA7A5